MIFRLPKIKKTKNKKQIHKHAIELLQVYTKTNSKRIINLNVNIKLKAFYIKHRRKSSGPEHSNEFIDFDSKSTSIKEK